MVPDCIMEDMSITSIESVDSMLPTIEVLTDPYFEVQSGIKFALDSVMELGESATAFW